MTLVAVKQPAIEKKAFRADFPFRIKEVTEESGDLLLEGYASTYVEDRDMESIERGAFDESAPDYLAKNPMLLYQHNPDWPIGVIQEATSDDVGIKVAALVTRPASGELPILVTAYEKTRRGVLRTFSVGGFFWRELRGDFEDPEIVVTKVEWLETSIVSIPANPDSLFRATMKAYVAGAVDVTITGRAQAQMAQLLGARRLTDPELEAMTPAERDERYVELCDVYLKAGAEPPERDAWTKVEKRVAEMTPEYRRTREGMAEALKLTLPVTAHLVGGIKRGRVLNAKNESRIRQIRDLATEVLDTLGEAVEEEGDVQKTAAISSGGLAGELAAATKQKPPNLRSGDTRGAACATCRFFKAGENDRGICDKHEHTVAAGALCDDYSARKGVELEEAKRISPEDLETYGLGIEGKRALGVADLPFAERDRSWDAGAAKRNVHGSAQRDDGSFDPATLRRAYLWLDDDADPTQVTGYRFIVADIMDGTMTYVPRGIFAAAGVLQGARGGTTIGEEGVAALKRSVETLYARMRERFDDDEITVPWADE